MLKDFDKWNNLKKDKDKLDRVHQIKEGEVYWCSIGLNIGDEQDGKGIDSARPVLIYKKFNNNIFIGLPLSTKIKDNKYYLKVILKDVEQAVMISQLRILDTKRLDKKVGYISKKDLLIIRDNVIKMMSIDI